MTDQERISLRDHFDEKFNDMTKANSEDHKRVIEALVGLAARVTAVEESRTGYVTWKQLGFGLTAGVSIVALLIGR